MEAKHQRTSDVARGRNSGYLTPPKVGPVTSALSFLDGLCRPCLSFASRYFDTSWWVPDEVGPLEPGTEPLQRSREPSKYKGRESL